MTPDVTTGNRVLAEFSREELPKILARFPGLRYSFEGEQREEREAMRELVLGLIAALRRFRPILLTAITTFLGLGPMILEKSTQALFLVPMAISLGVGTLVSTLVILPLIPATFRIVEDFSRFMASASAS